MKTKCYSIRLQSLVSISDKAFKATAFDGSEAILPKSQVFGDDFEISKSDAYWVAAWILEKKDLQYSQKKCGWYDTDTRNIKPHVEISIETHVPDRMEPINIEPNKVLLR